MSETQQAYVVRFNLGQLTIEERNQMGEALAVLTPHQILQIAQKILEVCAAPGIGRVYITIDKGHPRRVGIDIQQDLEL